MIELTKLADLFNVRFPEQDQRGVFHWIRNTRQAVAKTDAMLRLYEPVLDVIGGNLYVINLERDLEEVLRLLKKDALTDVRADVWGFLSTDSRSFWFSTLNNNAGGPTFFATGLAANKWKPAEFSQVFPPELNQNVSTN